MHTLYPPEVLFVIVLHINVLVSAQQISQADIINECINSTDSTPCSHTYEQLYQSLAKSENSFNISYALYPGGSKLSSVRVLVNVYGPNKTMDSTPAAYTWSMSCLYSAFPPYVLEVLSLGSILVKDRTQELNIHIPLFCCNVSGNREKRKEKIDGFLTTVLSELQDLADSPGIRNPKLNTAKCIIQGHELNINAKGPYVRIILYCSLGFVILSGPLLSKFVLAMQEKDNKTQKEKNIAKAIYILCCVVLVVGSILLMTAFGLSIKGKASPEITCTIILVVGYTVIPFLVLFCLLNVKSSCCSCLVIVTSANVTSYLFCWLMIGIMINPTWGLTVALLVCSISAALVYAVYLYLDTTDDNSSQVAAENSSCSKKLHTFLFCGSGFFAVLLLVVIILFAGQSYNSKETADEVLKTILLYFIGAFISWISWKKHPLHPGTAQNALPPTGTAQNGPPPAETAQNGPPPAGTAQNGPSPAGTAQNGPSPAGTAQNGPPPAGTVKNGSKAQNVSVPVSCSRSSSKGKGYTKYEMQHLIDKAKRN